MKRVRVLNLTENRGHAGGPEVFISSMIKAFLGWCDGAYYNNADGRFCEDAEEIVSYDRHREAERGSLRRLRRVIAEWRPDIIHMHWPPAMMYGQIARVLARSSAKTVSHFHGLVGQPSDPNSLLHPRRLLRHRMQRRCIGASDAILSCSRATGAAAAAHWRLDPGRIEVLPNPVDVRRWSNANADTSFRSELGVRDDEVLFTFVGRMGRVKGLDVLCEAVGLIDADVGVRVAIIGPGDPQQFDDHITDRGRIAFVGPVDHDRLPGLLKASDAFVLPSRWEGLPLVILEAAAAGLPVVASDVGGVSEAVEDGVTGFLVPPEDRAALAQAIQRIAEHRDESVDMGRRGRQRVETFDVHAVARRLERTYSTLLSMGSL